MHHTEPKPSWIKKFGVTTPIKSIMSSVDALEQSYKSRLAAIRAEQKQDIEAILACYKQETQKLEASNQQLADQLVQTIEQLHAAEKLYQKEHVEHKIPRERLQHTRDEIIILGKALKSEQKLISLTEQKIQAISHKLQAELAAKLLAKESPKPIKRLNFFMQIFKTRNHKKNPAQDLVSKENLNNVSF